jgi:hypothetical protein
MTLLLDFGFCPLLLSTACLIWLDVRERHINTVCNVVKYNVQMCSIVLNRNYSYVIPLYSIVHEGNAIGSMLTVQCSV